MPEWIGGCELRRAASAPTPGWQRVGCRLACALAWLGLLVALPGGVAAGAAEPAPVRLGAVSNFAQGWRPRTLDAATRLGVPHLRDGTRWRDSERAPGRYRFGTKRTGFPGEVLADGIGLTLVVNWGNPLYDGGDTPTSGEAVAAHGAFVAALVAVFPALAAVEVGNEFNGANFVRGPLARATPKARARAHLAILSGIDDALRAAGADVTLLGGATHSIPAGYLWSLLDEGAAGLIDALAIHPYTTRAEELAGQIGVLRRHRAARNMPIEVTEFGTTDAAAAPAHLVKTYAALAPLGVTGAMWYPLNARGDGFVPLVDESGKPTGAGRAFAFASRLLAPHPARDVSPDPFTYAVQFGEGALVLWGEPRDVTYDPAALNAYDAGGTRIAATTVRLAMDTPVVFAAAEGGAADFGAALAYSPQTIVADTYHQFGYPGAGGRPPAGDPFERFARSRGRTIALRTMPGQQVRAEPWVPYVGLPELRPLRITARRLLPVRRRAGPVEIVIRHVADRAADVLLDARFAPADRSVDGITVSLALNGAELASAAGRTGLAVEGMPLRLAAGDVLEFVVGPGATATGDVTDYAVRLRRPPP